MTISRVWILFHSSSFFCAIEIFNVCFSIYLHLPDFFGHCCVHSIFCAYIRSLELEFIVDSGKIHSFFYHVDEFAYWFPLLTSKSCHTLKNDNFPTDRM
jgi:hypothetical protein